MYAWIVPDIISTAVDKPFLYTVPDGLREVSIGSVVEVPFGRGNKKKRGYVIGIDESVAPNDPRLLGKSLNDMKIKPIVDVVDSVHIDRARIELAVWIKERYGSGLSAAIRTVMITDNGIRPRKNRIIRLIADRGSLLEYYEHNIKRNNKARLRLCEALLESDALDYSIAVQELNISASVIKRLAADNIIEVEERGGIEGSRINDDFNQDLNLTNEQNQAVTGILKNHQKKITNAESSVALLHGVTGSGKTAVYMELISKIVAEGKQAILLIPEISLTLQNVIRFHKRFHNRVSFIHSRLSKGERNERLQMAANGEIDIMIGPRSALFTPFKSIGLIIIDEEHEGSYSSDRMPKYNAIEVGIKIAEMNKALVLLGSATPSIESYYRAISGEYALFELKERYGEADLPQVRIVDMKQELMNGNRSMLSNILLDKIADRLDKKEQIMLFLNRRGYYGFNACRACGTVIKCPHCDVSLSLHIDGRLKCHYCGYERRAYTACPVCSSGYIGSMNSGTQQVEEYLKSIFPEAVTLRMDADTTTGKNDINSILESFSMGEADILIGTQMIVKGHDFGNVTLMGILLADLSLNISSYTASERTFQLIMQAAGRAGRSSRFGEVVLQAYNTDHFSIRAAAMHDYQSFYKEESEYRRLMSYPPFSDIMLITMECEDEEYLISSTHYMKKFLLLALKGVQAEIIGPAVPVIPKINDRYRRHIYLKHKSFEGLIALRNKIESYVAINRGYDRINIQFDYRNL